MKNRIEHVGSGIPTEGRKGMMSQVTALISSTLNDLEFWCLLLLGALLVSASAI